MSAGTKTGDHPVDIAQALGPRLAAGAAERDRDRVFPYEQITELKESGLCGLWVPPEAGGLGGDARDLVRVLVALAEGDPSVAQMYLIHMYGVALIKGVRCPEELRERYYRRLVDEGLFITNAFSETSGKTVFDYGVTFEPTDSGTWRISGRKSYCTGSLGGDVFYVLGVCPGDPEPVFRVALVERGTAGLTVHDDWTGMGQRTTASGTVAFDDVRVPAELCFDIEHFNTPESLFGSLGQCMFSAIFTGIARAALSDACAYVRTRSRPWPHAGVERASDDPYVLHAIGRMQTLVSAAETMVERAVDVRLEAISDLSPQTRDWASVAASEAKIVCGQTALDVSELLFQVCGAGAVLAEFGLDRHWRNARTLTLHDPATYKLRLIGDHALNGTPPPISVYT
ncbi:MAG: acyl-CoA dehydrogenase family protein [Actinomycetia bacterium]|nr:acyl-CoA dehydrogenase family protein [Actinomycetes bacterium]